MSAYSIGLAQARYNAATENLIDEVRRTYPVGCTVSVTVLGRPRFDAEVLAHGCPANPGRVLGRNKANGEHFHFYPHNVVRRITDRDMVDTMKVVF